MRVNLLTEHYLEFLSLKEATKTRLSLPHGGNHMSRLTCDTNNVWMVNIS